jgi:hypothetical protein
MAVLNIRRLARSYGWSPAQILEAPAQLIHDLLEVDNLASRMR